MKMAEFGGLQMILVLRLCVSTGQRGKGSRANPTFRPLVMPQEQLQGTGEGAQQYAWEREKDRIPRQD